MGLRYRALAFLALLSACEDSEYVENVYPVAYDYTLELPAYFEPIDVIGTDSKVEEFRSPDTTISTDFGHYSGPPQCSSGQLSCKIDEENIAGREALIGIYRHGANEQPGEPKPFRVFVHIKVAPKQGLALNLFARCDTRAACRNALRYFRQVRIFRFDPPPAAPNEPPPPPPPPRAVEDAF